MPLTIEQEYGMIPRSRNEEIERNFPGASMERRVLDSLARSAECEAAGLKPPLIASRIRPHDLETFRIRLMQTRHFLSRLETVLDTLQGEWDKRRSKLEVVR